MEECIHSKRMQRFKLRKRGHNSRMEKVVGKVRIDLGLPYVIPYHDILYKFQLICIRRT